MEKNLTALEVIGIAIVKEREAQDLYQRMASEIKNPLVKEKFLSLSREEHKHEEILAHMYKKMTGEDHAAVPPMKGRYSKVEFPDSATSFEGLLLFAIEREKDSQHLYLRGAEVAADESGRRTFRYLADFERGHELLLQRELENYRRDKNWHADCPDIILVGP